MGLENLKSIFEEELRQTTEEFVSNRPDNNFNMGGTNLDYNYDNHNQNMPNWWGDGAHESLSSKDFQTTDNDIQMYHWGMHLWKDGPAAVDQGDPLDLESYGYTNIANAVCGPSSGYPTWGSLYGHSEPDPNDGWWTCGTELTNIFWDWITPNHYDNIGATYHDLPVLDPTLYEGGDTPRDPLNLITGSDAVVTINVGSGGSGKGNRLKVTKS